MVTITEKGRWSNATVNAKGRRVFSNGLDEKGMRVFTISAGGTNVTVTAVAATATAAANAPVVSAQRQVAVTSVAATATANALAPSVATGGNVTVSAVVANATASAPAPVVSVGVTVSAVRATATASALAPSVGSSTNVSVNAIAANASAQAVAPSVTASRAVNIASVAATAAASAVAPVFGIVFHIVGEIELVASRVKNIPLVASRVKSIPLLASRISVINWKGALPVAEVNQNGEMYSGESKNIPVTATENGAAIPLTGATITWGLRRVNAPANDLTKTTPSGITITDAAGGIFQINLTPTDTANLNGDYIHEARIVDGAGFSSVVMEGRLYIKPSIV